MPEEAVGASETEITGKQTLVFVKSSRHLHHGILSPISDYILCIFYVYCMYLSLIMCLYFLLSL